MSRLARLLRPPRRGVAFALVAAALLLRAVPAHAIDGTWQESPPIVGRSFTTAILDPSRDRLLVVGGLVAYSLGSVDVWSVNLTGPPVWTKLVSDGPGPVRRTEHNVIFDTANDRLILFGGANSQTGAYLNDVWALNLSGPLAWTALAPAGTPPAARAFASATYDPVRQRMLVFGGGGGASMNDLWELSLGATPAWTQLTPGGSPPSARFAQSAVYDPVGDRLVVYGGSVVGGATSETWTLSLGGPLQWALLSPGGTPPARLAHSAVYDPVGNRMVVFGGTGAANGFNDLWALTLGSTPTWGIVTANGIPPDIRYGHSAVYDPANSRMLVFGGWWQNEFYGDVASLSLSGTPGWSSLWPENAFQQGRQNHAAIYDPVRKRLVTFGGDDLSFNPTNEVWAFALEGPPAWTKLAPTGSGPGARDEHSAIYDPVRDRMLVFGGYGGSTDVWALSLAGGTAWSLIVDPAGTPPAARIGHSAIYDPVRDRMILFGGADAGGYLRDVWALSLSGTPTWTELLPASPRPTSRYGHSAIYDPISDRMIIFGGSGAGDVTNDTWALTLSGTPTWSLIVPGGVSPPARSNHTAVYDAARTRMVVYGGANAGSNGLNDVWAIDVNSASLFWQHLTLPNPMPFGRRNHVAIADPVGDRMVVHGGGLAGPFADTWWAQWPASTGVPTPSVPVALRLGASVPNPASGALAITFGLPAAATARLTVLDLQGRVIRTLVRAALPAGSHVAHWDGRTASGARARSGVYLYRLDALGDHRSGRLVITE